MSGVWYTNGVYWLGKRMGGKGKKEELENKKIKKILRGRIINSTAMHDSWKRQDQQRKKMNSSVVANSLSSQYYLSSFLLYWNTIGSPNHGKQEDSLTDRRCSDLLRFADLEARQSGNSGGMRESRSLHSSTDPPIRCPAVGDPCPSILSRSLTLSLSLLHFLLIWRLYDVLRTLCAYVCVEVHKVGRAVALSLRTSLLHILLTF